MEPGSRKRKVSIYWLVIFQILLVFAALVALFVIMFWGGLHSCKPTQCAPWVDPKFGFYDWAFLAGAIAVLTLAVVTFVLITLRWKIAREASIAFATLAAGLFAWIGFESAQPEVVLGETYQSYYGAIVCGLLVIMNIAWIAYFIRSRDVRATLSRRVVANEFAQNSQTQDSARNP